MEIGININALAEKIVRQHAATFAPFTPQAVPDSTETASVYRAALQACSALGFIAIDAGCLARAWQARFEHTGDANIARWPQTPAYFGLTPAPQDQAFAACPRQLGLYAVLPDAAWVGRMARAGVPTVQLRFKSDDADAIAREVHHAVQAVQGTGARLFINDHWHAALAVGAYGVHLGQEDLDALQPHEVASLRASGVRLGVSTHGYAEMLRAAAVWPSYIAMGAVFPTTLKRMETAPQGVARLAAYAGLMQQFPLVAIGGIGPEHFAQIAATGVGSIAVVRALVNAPDPEAAAAQLLQAMAA